MMRILALLSLLAAVPAAPAPLAVRMGESWVFSVRDGEPVNARKVGNTATPAHNQIRVSLQPMMGTTMTVTNNSPHDYAYRATLVVDGKPAEAKSCAVPANGRLAIEHWPKPVSAVILSHFRAAPAGSLCP
jgi:hypothetical protein